MHPWLRRLTIATLLWIPLAAPAAALAGPPALEDEAIDTALTPEAVTAACLLTTGPINTFSWIWTPPEELKAVAWKLPLTACTACAASGGVLNLTNVRIRMRWFKPCSATAEVSIIGAKQGVTCLEPDPTQVLCPPTAYTISSTINGTVQHTLPLAAACCVTGDAFVQVRFTGLGACAANGFSPGLTSATPACTPCSQFVTATVIHPNGAEWCAAGGTNPMWFSIDADCCAATPNLGQSWGGVKALYR